MYDRPYNAKDKGKWDAPRVYKWLQKYIVVVVVVVLVVVVLKNVVVVVVDVVVVVQVGNQMPPV